MSSAFHNGGSSKYRARGLQAAFVGKAQKDEAVREGVAKGNHQLIVFMSPEAGSRQYYCTVCSLSPALQSMACRRMQDRAEGFGPVQGHPEENAEPSRSCRMQGTLLIGLSTTNNESSINTITMRSLIAITS